MEIALILFSIAAGLIAGIVAFAVLSRINGSIEEVDHVEPIGDMANIKSLINKYED